MKSNPFNLFRYWKKHGWKETKKQWNYNFLMLDTPEQSIKKEIYGFIGLIGALFFATVSFAVKGSWAVTAVFTCSLWLAYVQLKQKLKQLKILRDMSNPEEEEYEEVGVDNNGL